MQVYSSPALGADGTSYVGSYDNHLHAVDEAGAMKWKYDTGQPVTETGPEGAECRPPYKVAAAEVHDHEPPLVR